MKQAVSQGMGFRHVVFPDAVGGHARALNVAPRPRLDDEADADARLDADPLPPDSESLFRWLFARAGLNFRHYKPETLTRRLPACLRAVRATSAAQARAVLRRNPDLVGPALDALLIGVTSFFRDEGVFDALRRRVLPDVVRRWRAGGCVRPLRVWSVGCSSGAELY